MNNDRGLLPDSLYCFLIAILLLTAASLAFSFAARQLGYGLPAASAYYFMPGDFFMDFLGFNRRALLFGTPDFFYKPRGEYLMYPAPLIFPIVQFFRLAHPARVFFLLVLTAGAGLSVAFYRVLRRAGLQVLAAALLVCIVFVTAYPFSYLIQRGNLEVLAWIPVTLGIWSVLKGRMGWASVLFGVAGALKLYPIIFMGLFLYRSRIKFLLLSFGTFVAVNIASLWWLGPTIEKAYQWNSVQLQAFGKFYAASVWAIGYDHSLFALIKVLTLFLHPDLTPWVRWYTASMATGCLLLFLFVIRKLPLINQLGSLSILSVIVAPVSYDYTLVTLYAFLAMLVLLAIEDWMQGHRTPFLDLLLGLFAVVLTPDSFVIIAGARFGAELRCVCLLTMLGVLLRVHLPELSSLRSDSWSNVIA